MIPRIRCLAAILTACIASAAVAADPADESPGHEGATDLSRMAAAIGDSEAKTAIEGLVSRADCSGPNGQYSTEIVSLANGTTRLVQRRDSGATHFLLATDRVYTGETGTAGLEPAQPFMAQFVRGHDVHRLLLELDQRLEAVDGGAETDCVGIQGPHNSSASICADPYGGLPQKFVTAVPEEMGGGRVAIEMADWRRVAGVRLPYSVDFVHDGQRFTYRYHAVLPFRLAPGNTLPGDPTMLFDRLGDLGDIAAVHERAMAAHRASDVDALIADEAAAGTVSSRGRLIPTDRVETQKHLGPYLASTRFSRYEDTVVPVIAVSGDGSLGWLACEMEAEGTQSTAEGDQDLAFGFSWFEMLARENGRWVRIGNASNQLP